MDPRSPETATEFVLDNRRLIIGFLLLIAVCGSFFVIGFMEGKRQSVQVPEIPPQTASIPVSTPPAAETQSSAPATDPKSTIRDQLDWYKNVQGSETRKTADATASPKTAAPSAGDSRSGQASASKAESGTLPNSAIPSVKSGKVTYSVQVGAFKQRQNAEAKTEALKAMGFNPFIAEPKLPDGSYLVRVGTFDTRAEALALQRKLTKAGISCIITN